MAKVCRGLKFERESKLLTQAEVADLCHTTQRTVSIAESGRGVSLGTVKKFATGLKVKPERILNDHSAGIENPGAVCSG